MPRSHLVISYSLRRRSSWRLARATLRDARVIWREFRQPILILLVALLGGGWVYGELLVRAGYERIATIDLPYTMLALMFFQIPTDLPNEPQLVAFWYIMPVVAAYVAARGAFDFVQLFFNPDEHRRHSWEEAVASTYRDHIIVLGVGHLGLRVIRALVGMGSDVVAIDVKSTPEKAAELERLHVPQVIGDGRLAETMESAGLRHAQAFIVCTSNDYMNLEVTMRARDLNPDLRIVVRMWEEQFAAQIRRFFDVQAVMSTTDLAAPSFAGSALGIEITQTLVIGDTEYSLIRLEVTPGSFLDGKTIGALEGEHAMDIVLHGQADDVQVHPRDDAQVHAGDTLVLFARHNKIMDVVARNQCRRTRQG